MIESLPHEIFAHVFDFLSGTDLFVIPTVSRSLHDELSNNDQTWRKRLLPTATTTSTTMTWKQQYRAATSMQFNGAVRGGAIPLPKGCAAKWRKSAFSVDLWVCVLRPPCESNLHLGGVLLGAQSTSWMEADKVTPNHYQQLVHVDNAGNLFCSVTNKKEKAPLAKLQLDRWHHVALTFSQTMQCVYLDGKVVRVEQGSLHHEWARINELQFGSGFMSLGSKWRPSEDFSGWYGFTGLLEAPRIWDKVLSFGDVESLARGGTVGQDTASGKDTLLAPLGNVTQVHCTRPLERHCVRPSTADGELLN